MKLPNEVKNVFKILRGAGYEVYIVGGSLRNILMGKDPYDWDMTTSALPGKTSEIFIKKGFTVIETGIKHGTVTVLADKMPIEITTFRLDGEYKDQRHPEKVTFTPSLSEDLARRDFTVNAMAYSDECGIIDLYGGIDDLKANILRAVGDPEKRFREDALRILRAFRFSSEHGFMIEEKTRLAITKCGKGLLKISRERICSELKRILMGDHADKALKELRSCGIMPYIFPCHLDSFTFSENIFPSLPKKLSARITALFINFTEEAYDTAICSLKMPNEEKLAANKTRDAVFFLSENGISRVYDARRFLQRFNELSHDALNIASLLGFDVLASQSLISEAEETPFPYAVSDLAISGSDILAFGVGGKDIGDVLTFLLDSATTDPSLNCREKLSALAKKYISEK
ncbi:MAG: CCA tRNA nucleotidyltransferase [Clostridia bacterium]|nr:CCA tRNA nucleotidyltransferase [Clostridia bacterium]